MAGGLQELDDDGDVIASVNVIPFVDIVLVLLIIFLLTANEIARASIPVELPRAATGGESVGPTVNIVVTASGDTMLDGTPVARERLSDEIRARFSADPRLRAVIAADKAVRYEYVIDVIDRLKQIGVDAFALNIERVR